MIVVGPWGNLRDSLDDSHSFSFSISKSCLILPLLLLLLACWQLFPGQGDEGRCNGQVVGFDAMNGSIVSCSTNNRKKFQLEYWKTLMRNKCVMGFACTRSGYDCAMGILLLVGMKPIQRIQRVLPITTRKKKTTHTDATKNDAFGKSWRMMMMLKATQWTTPLWRKRSVLLLRSTGRRSISTRNESSTNPP